MDGEQLGALVAVRACALGGKTRLKTGSYAARCGKRAGRVRLEQRPVHRRTDPGTSEPGQALTGETSPRGDASRRRKTSKQSSDAKRSTNPTLLPVSPPLSSSPPRFSSACPLLFPPLFPLLLLLSAPQEGAATHRQCRCSPRRIYPRRCLFFLFVVVLFLAPTGE